MGIDKNIEEVGGVVEEALPNTLFKVRLEQGEVLLAYLAGRMPRKRYASASSPVDGTFF